jgi:hypothetical protein
VLLNSDLLKRLRLKQFRSPFAKLSIEQPGSVGMIFGACSHLFIWHRLTLEQNFDLGSHPCAILRPIHHKNSWRAARGLS